jgi:hypothetical protein
MPPDLDYPRGVDIWRTTRSIPANSAFGIAAQREVNLIGRLRPGVTIEQASSELAALDQQLATDAPTDYLRRGFNIVVRPFAEVVIGDVRRTMIALFGAVAFVLLIASANVANLLLMRGESRGASWLRAPGRGAWPHRRSVLAESLVLSLIAGIAGFLLAWVALPLLITIIPDGLPRIESIRIDATVAAFSVGVVFVTALLAGIVPGLFSMRGDLVSPLRGQRDDREHRDAWAPNARGGTGRAGRDGPRCSRPADSQYSICRRSIWDWQPSAWLWSIFICHPRPTPSASAARSFSIRSSPARSGAWDLGRDPSQRRAVHRSRMGRATSHCRRTRQRSGCEQSVAEPGVDSPNYSTIEAPIVRGRRFRRQIAKAR